MSHVHRFDATRFQWKADGKSRSEPRDCLQLCRRKHSQASRRSAKNIPASSVLISVTSWQKAERPFEWPCNVATSIPFIYSMLIRTTHAKHLMLVSVRPWLWISVIKHAPILSKALKPIPTLYCAWVLIPEDPHAFTHQCLGCIHSLVASTCIHSSMMTHYRLELQSAMPWLFLLSVCSCIHPSYTCPPSQSCSSVATKRSDEYEQIEQPMLCDSCILSTPEYQSVTK